MNILFTLIMFVAVCSVVLSAQSAVSKQMSHAETPAAALQSCPTVEEEIVDLDLLASGLKKSRAIGFFEKVQLKFAIDELIGRFGEFHDGVGHYSLAELQEQYDVLLMRIASHLQHKDTQLHGQLCNAWPLILEDLRHPESFMEKFA